MELFSVKRVVPVLVLWYETRRVWSWPPSHSKFDYKDPSGTKCSRISNWDRSKQSHSWGPLCNSQHRASIQQPFLGSIWPFSRGCKVPYDNAWMISGLKLSSTLPTVASKFWKQRLKSKVTSGGRPKILRWQS